MGLEPENEEVVIWRSIRMGKFRVLVTSGELYLSRADRFNDDSEGLPPLMVHHASFYSDCEKVPVYRFTSN
jgi:hypothetical protein